MTEAKIKCANFYLKEYFGPIVTSIADQLMKNGPLNLKNISFLTKESIKTVKESLKILIQHNFVTFELNNRNIVEYIIDIDAVLCILNYPYYVYISKTIDENYGSLFAEEIIKSGQICLNNLISIVLEKVCSTNRSIQNKFELPKKIYDSFAKFVKGDFFCSKETNKIPNINLQLFIKVLLNDTEEKDEIKERPLKKLKTENDNSESNVHQDQKIFWLINTKRFNKYLLGIHISEALKAHYDDDKIGKISQIIYNLIKDESDSNKSEPVSVNLIIKTVLEEKICEEAIEVMDYLNYFELDFCNRFIYKVENKSEGGMYTLNKFNIINYMLNSCLSTIVRDCYGEKSCRIFKLLLIKKFLQQKQVGELAMISAKDAKERTYTLFKDGFIKILQYSKTPEYAPLKTFYVFSVDLNELCLTLINKCFLSIYSLAFRRIHEFNQKKTLIEKKILIDAIIENLKNTQENGLEEQVNDLNQTFTSHEKELLSKSFRITRKLELCELQINQTLFLLQNWLSLNSSKTC